MLLNTCRQFRTSAALGRARTLYYNKHKPVKGPDRQDPDYFEKQAATLPLDEQYIDGLKLLWDEKIGNERELIFKAPDRLIGREEGDYGLPKIASLRPKVEYQNVPELQDAPEEIKKIFSVEFGKRVDHTRACKQDLIDVVRDNPKEKNSLQTKIAWCTVEIRQLTELVDDLQTRDPRRPTVFLTRIHALLGYRRRLLRELREQDYESFVKILDTLKISYQVPKNPEHLKTRKAWSLFILKKRVDDEKERIMEVLRKEFEQDKESKIQKLGAKLNDLQTQREEIQEQLKEYGRIESRVPENVVGKYQLKLVEELTEFVNHATLFYHSLPVKKVV